MTPPLAVDGTKRGGHSRLAWERVTADSDWQLFAWMLMRCHWCSWVGTRFRLVEHWLEVHDGRTNFCTHGAECACWPED